MVFQPELLYSANTTFSIQSLISLLTFLVASIFILPISIPHTLPHSLCLHVSLCFTAPHPHPTPYFLSILSSLSLLGWYRRNWSLSGVKHRDSLEVQTELLLPRWGSAKIPVLLECSRDEKHTNLNTQTLKIQGHGMGSVGNMVRINCKNSRINPPTMTFPPPPPIREQKTLPCLKVPFRLTKNYKAVIQWESQTCPSQV